MSPNSRGKVHWTAEEQDFLLKKTVEIHFVRPELGVLSLFREAVKHLPLSRRRDIVSLAQADWFEPRFTGAVRLKLLEIERSARPVTLEASEKDPYVPILCGTRIASEAVAAALEQMARRQRDFFAEMGRSMEGFGGVIRECAAELGSRLQRIEVSQSTILWILNQSGRCLDCPLARDNPAELPSGVEVESDRLC